MATRSKARERKNKQLSTCITQTLYNQLAAEADRAGESISNMAYILLRIGHRIWTSGDDIATGTKADQDRAKPTINLSRLD
jgi:hypothetical protein